MNYSQFLNMIPEATLMVVLLITFIADFCSSKSADRKWFNPLGMFIPLELNVPLLVGGAINWYVTSRSKDAKVDSERGEKGTRIASGFIAGGALMGVVSALLKFGGIEVSIADSWWVNPMSEVCSLLAYICLIGFFIRATKK